MSIKNRLGILILKGKKNSFLKGFSFLLGGTAITQIISLLLAPILTRLYSPEDYGINSLYISTISILSVFATLRFNSAIIIAKNIFERTRLVRLSVFTTIIISFATLCIVVLIYLFGTFVDLLWLWFVPISTLFLGFYEVQYAAVLNQNKFKVLAQITIVKIACQGILQILFAILGWGYIGLILGNIFSIIIGLFIIFNIRETIRLWNNAFDFSKHCKTFQEFIEFPKFAFPAEVASITSVMLFPFLISYLYTVEEVGHFALANKLIGIPIGLFGNSVRQVFVRDVSPHFLDYKILKTKYLNTSKILLLLGVACSFLLYFFGPPFFSLVFGEEWAISGIYVQALIALFISRITISPLLSILNVIRKQKVSLIINSSLIFVMVITTFIIKTYFHIGMEAFLLTTSLALGFVYLVAFFWILKLLKA